MEGNQVGGIDARDESPWVEYRRECWEKIPAHFLLENFTDQKLTNNLYMPSHNHRLCMTIIHAADI
jgi:hypothetical protein